MKNNIRTILIVVLCPIGAMAQPDPRAHEIQKLMWDNPQPEFTVTAAPEKWKDEPAVILAISEETSYKKGALSSRLEENNYYHERTIILNQQALEEYAQFRFPQSRKVMGYDLSYYIGFKIIKPDGREIVVPLDGAVKEEIETKGSSKWAMMKLAIPNLEIGDIIDFYRVSEERFVTDKFHSFDPNILLLRKKYPTVYGKVAFTVLRRCFINLKTYNGDHQFVRTPGENDEDTYTLEYTDREKLEDYPWFFPYRSLPSVKFKVTYASPMAATMANTLLDAYNPGKLKSEVTAAELKTYLSARFSSLSVYKLLSPLKYMKKNFKGEKNQAKLVREAFYHQRNQLAVKNAERASIYGNEAPRMYSHLMVANLATYFKKAGISYDLILGVPRSIGDVDDIILEEEILVGLKTRTQPPIFIANYGMHSLPGEIAESLEGAKVYISSLPVNTSNSWEFIPYTMPVSSAADNNELTNVEVKLDVDQQKAALMVTKGFIGHARTIPQNIFMDAYDFIDEEKETYDMKPWAYGLIGSFKMDALEAKEAYEAEREKTKFDRVSEQLKAMVDFEVDTVHSIKIVNTGRRDTSAIFEVSYLVESEDLFQNVGDNILLDVGKIIQSQIRIDKKYRENREFDIYRPYASSFTDKIQIEIPEGYTVEGLEALNISVTNAGGGFVAKAETREGVVFITCEKYYKKNHEPASRWPLLLEFIDAAQDFHEQKLLFRKHGS